MPRFKLMTHQVEGVKFLDSVDGIGALLWDPGVGKTGATLAWIDSLADRIGQVRVLVVAPLTAADTWVLQVPGFMDSPTKARMLTGSTVHILGEMRKAALWQTVPNSKIMVNHRGEKHKGNAGNRVTILSMSAGAVSDFCKVRTRTIQMLQAVRKYAPHVIIVDESHIIKSHNANISKAMYQIGQLAPHRIILTGTVNPKDRLDVYGQWRFLAPWTFSSQYKQAFTKTPLKMTKAEQMSIRPWNWTQFKHRYTVPGGYMGKGIGGFINLDELDARVAERSHVVRKEDALDLPPVRDVDVHVTLSPKEQKFYNEMRDELAAMLDSGELIEAPNPLAKMMKLRQVTAGFVKDTDLNSPTYEQVFVVGDSKRKAMMETACVTLAGEQRLVVFGYFKRECYMLAEELRKREPGSVVEVITGETKFDDRLAIRQRFGDVSRNPTRMILVAQQRTMSISVNELVTAQNAIYGSQSERRQDWVQSRGRLDRNGQVGQHVTFWNCFVPDSVDSIMLDNHKARGDLEKSLLDYIKATPRKRK